MIKNEKPEKKYFSTQVSLYFMVLGRPLVSFITFPSTVLNPLILNSDWIISNSFSVITATPSSLAFTSLLPLSSPAKTYDVFLETDDEERILKQILI